MNKTEIIDINGNKIQVDGIYYISNNNYYFIYSKGETDSNNRIVLYFVKILQEVVNNNSKPTPTGYLIGLKVADGAEYEIVKNDIANIVNEKQNGAEAKVRYLDLSMLKNLKIRDNRSFKINLDMYNNLFKTDTSINNVDNTDYKTKYEELLKENEELQKKIDSIKDILK